jgi:DNA mismatch repair protein MutS
MMAQYRRLKDRYPQAILFFRLGDFYEMFGEDARLGAKVLDLTLTQRSGVPMCGVPHHAATTYTNRLLKAGHTVAICEQTPGGDKDLMAREVVEVVTPGTVVDPALLSETRNNYLLSLAGSRGRVGAAYVDLSTGQFAAVSFPEADAGEAVRALFLRLGPSELLVQETVLGESEALARVVSEHRGVAVNRLPDWSFDQKTNAARLREQFGMSTLAGLGLSDTDLEVACAGVILDYLGETARSLLPHIRSLRRYTPSSHVGISEATQRNLELVQNLTDGGTRYTLYEVLNTTRTAMGARTLREWILSPLRDAAPIRGRHDVVEWLYRNQRLLARVREALAGVYDLERLGSRVAVQKAHAKDLLAVAASLAAAAKASEVLQDAGEEHRRAATGQPDAAETPGHPDATAGLLRTLRDRTADLAGIRERIERAILEEPSLVLTDGNLMRPGYDATLDRLRDARRNAKGLLEELLTSERQSSGIGALKLRYNRVIGHFFEVTKSHLERVPTHFRRRQSLAGAERFTTDALARIESDLLDAEERIADIERTLFLALRETVCTQVAAILDLGRAVGELDVLAAFAHDAALRGYVRPSIHDDGRLVMREGRHPVVEAYLGSRAFVPNGLDLAAGSVRFVMLTGPNMAGKSTFLRQVALITLMAQMGSYVPAAQAQIGLVDQVFCRVGASDNLARGESTFLVEMSETAYILRSATSSSLLIFDEVGRGTSTREGQAIARAVAEHIVDHMGTRTLFATHFHELTRVQRSAIVNLSMEVAEEGGKVVFLNRIRVGPADQSYALHVARIAGVPEGVIRVAAEHLRTGAEPVLAPPALTPPPDEQALLFRTEDMVLDEIRAVAVNETRPIDALSLIARWKRELGSDRP